MTTTVAHLLHWSLAMGSTPEVATALATHATSPIPPAADALYRAVVALQVEARDYAGTPRGASAEVASRLVLGIAAYHSMIGGAP